MPVVRKGTKGRATLILRLKAYRLLMKAAVYSLSIPAFYLGRWGWSVICVFLGRPALYSLHSHLNQVLFGTLVWAFVSEHYKVTSFDELFRERTGAWAASYACTAATFVLLAALYFSRNVLFPRGILVCDIVAIFALTLILHAVLRALCRSRTEMGKPTKLLMAGCRRICARHRKTLAAALLCPLPHHRIRSLAGSDGSGGRAAT